MLPSIRSRIRASVLSSLVFASIALLSACSGGSSEGNNGGGSEGAPVIANTQPLVGTINSVYSFTFGVSNGGQAPFTWSETGALPPKIELVAKVARPGTPPKTSPSAPPAKPATTLDLRDQR